MTEWAKQGGIFSASASAWAANADGLYLFMFAMQRRIHNRIAFCQIVQRLSSSPIANFPNRTDALLAYPLPP